jgi:hypothetical protein
MSDDPAEILGSNLGADEPVAKPRARKPKDNEERMWIQLEENPDIPPTGLPIGVNGEVIIIMPSQPVHVPRKYIDVLDNAVVSVPMREPGTDRVIGHRDRRRFPYQRVAAPDDAS